MEFQESARTTLEAWMNTERGVRSKLGRELGVKASFISQVLSGKNRFTPEQGIGVARFFHLNARETEHWLDLVAIDRAGSAELRAFLKRRAERSRGALHRIRERLRATSSDQAMSLEQQARYYSSWVFGAIHILTTIPEYRTAQAIGQRLGLRQEDLQPAIQFLVGAGLITVSPDGTIETTVKRVHLDREAPWIRSHHAQWRAHALESLNRRSTRQDVHFSSAMTLSRADARKIHEDILTLIQGIDQRLPLSREEECMVLTLDWFPL